MLGVDGVGTSWQVANHGGGNPAEHDDVALHCYSHMVSVRAGEGRRGPERAGEVRPK